MPNIELNNLVTEFDDTSFLFGITASEGGQKQTITSSKDFYVGKEKIIVTQSNAVSIFGASLDSTKLYFIDGVIDLTGLSVSIEVPVGGLYLAGYNFDLSGIICSDNNYEMFTSPVSGSGNFLFNDLYLSASGTNASVFALVSSTGNQTVEISRVNFNSCSSLGYLDNYRQLLENGTGRFGGAPELEFRNGMNGVRITTSIARNVTIPTALFKAGTGLSFTGRFLTDLNCDLPATGALLDFADSNFANDENLKLNGTFITREGVSDSSDTSITPNITQSSVKSYWKNNVGIPNTVKYLKASLTTEVLTTIAVTNTYYPLLGTFTVDLSSHFDMPTNGQFRLLSGNGTYEFNGDIPVSGTASDEVDIRVTKSTDGGATFPTEISHIKRVINNLSGGRNVAFFPVSFIASLKKDERVRLEIENKTAANNVTAELDSFFIIKEA